MSEQQIPVVTTATQVKPEEVFLFQVTEVEFTLILQKLDSLTIKEGFSLYARLLSQFRQQKVQKEQQKEEAGKGDEEKSDVKKSDLELVPSDQGKEKSSNSDEGMIKKEKGSKKKNKRNRRG